MTRILMILALVFSAATARAQSYPEYISTTVNDFAGLLDAEAETRLSRQLDQLRQKTGVEMTVLTLSRQDMFAPEQTLEQFATGLFNAWGIGDKTRNDGVLVMVLRTDRAMRIELGSAYGSAWNRHAASIINRSFLSAFKEDRYQDGIEAGVSDTIDSIVMPFLAGTDAPGGQNDTWVWAVVMTVFGAMGALVFKDKLVKLKKCPQCGTRHLERTRKVIARASKTTAGHGEVMTTCSNCSYRNVAPYSISKLSSSRSSSSFGGGSSSGGGASGRW